MIELWLTTDLALDIGGPELEAVTATEGDIEISGTFELALMDPAEALFKTPNEPGAIMKLDLERMLEYILEDGKRKANASFKIAFRREVDDGKDSN